MWRLFDRFLLFLSRFVQGLKFAAIEYDEQLQRTKTPKERLIRWMIVIGVLFILSCGVVLLIRALFNTFRFT